MSTEAARPNGLRSVFSRARAVCVAAAALFVAAITGWLWLTPPHAWGGVELGLVLFAVALVVTFILMACLVAAQAERSEAARRQADSTLHESRERYSLAVRGSRDGIWDWNVLTGESHYSDRVYSLLGYTIGEFPQTYESWAAKIHPDDRERVMANLRDHLDTDAVYDVEYRMVTKAGDVRWFNSRGRALRDATGRVVRMAGSFADITERKRAAADLAEREQEFRALFESVAVGMAQVSADTGRFTRVNDKFCEIIGYTREELLRRGPASLNCSTEYVLGPERLAALVRGEEPDYAAEKRYVRKDGSILWAETTATVVRDETGRTSHTIMVIHDVTARREAQDELARAKADLETRVDVRTTELQQANRQLSGVLRLHRQAEDEAVGLHTRLEAVLRAATQVSIIATDPDGLITLFNPGAERMLGYTAAEMIGRQTPALIHLKAEVAARGQELTRQAGRPVSGFEVLVHAARNGGHEEREWTYRHKSGRRLTVLLAVTAKRERDGRLVGFLGIATDITRRKADEQELRQAKLVAEAAARAKGEFLANMSHEIRTPMNGILGMTDLVLGTRLEPEQREFLGMVKSSAERLLLVINDVLDFSKVDAGKLDLHPAPFSLREVVGGAARLFTPQAAAKGVELTCRIATDTPDGLRGDAGRLTQVLVNLLGNAVKFTDRGEVGVEVEVLARGEWGTELRVSVTDTGIGIPADQRAAIFDAFTQGATDLTRQRGGTGLGLAISARLVELMGGRVWVESEPGRGSTFRFTARLSEADIGPSVESPSRLVRLKGGRALVADDNPTNRRILVEAVTAWGMTAEEVAGGREAIAALDRAAAAREPFQVVLADIEMPGVGGFAVAEHAHAHPDRAAAVVLLCSGTGPDSLARARELGVPAVIKPVSQPDLFKVVWQAVACGHPVPPAVAMTETPPPNRRQLRVLVAEDQPVNQRLIHRLLADGGHEPVLVTNGREALDRLATEPFDVVLMDVQMPVLDGLAATAEIRASEGTGGRRTPVIALTAYALPADRERCLAAGCDSYLAKPIRRTALYAALDAMSPAGTVASAHAPV